MFRLHRLQDTLPIPPSMFASDLANVVVECIDAKYSNRVRGSQRGAHWDAVVGGGGQWARGGIAGAPSDARRC